MLQCPNCKMEYRDGFTVCADCGIDLAQAQPSAQKTDADKIPSIGDDEPMRIVKVFSTSSTMTADMAEAALEENGIPFLRKPRGAGGYVGIMHGYSCYGDDFFVAESMRQSARDILAIVEEGAYVLGLESRRGNDTE